MTNKFTPKTSNIQPSEELWAGTDHLDSWKEIASYLRREIRTVQLWEKKEGLPIHRHFHKQLGSVYALRSEIERWKLQVSRKTDVHEPERWRDPIQGRKSDYDLRAAPDQQHRQL